MPDIQKSLVVRVPVQIHRALKIAAAKSGQTIQQLVIDALSPVVVVEPQDRNSNHEPGRA